MKKIFLFLVVCLFIGACSSFKKKEKLLKTRYEELLLTQFKQQLLQMNHKSIATQGAQQTEEEALVLDSLYFHPDSGFRLKAGFVKAKIRRVSTSFHHLQQSQDTLKRQIYEDAQLTRKIALQQEIKSQQHKRQKPGFVFGGLLLLFALAGSYWLWKQR